MLRSPLRSSLRSSLYSPLADKWEAFPSTPLPAGYSYQRVTINGQPVTIDGEAVYIAVRN